MTNDNLIELMLDAVVHTNATDRRAILHGFHARELEAVADFLLSFTSERLNGTDLRNDHINQIAKRIARNA